MKPLPALTVVVPVYNEAESLPSFLPRLLETMGAMVVSLTLRPPRAGEDASEVWVYRRTDLEARVGFRNNVVAWLNHGSEDAAQAAAAAATPRQALVPGRPCATLEADLGPAEGIEEDFDAAVGRRVLHYRWSPTTADNETTFVVCDQGVVASVRHAR